MESLASFQSLSSMAVGPVLMMNWRRVATYFPAVERFIDKIDVDVVLQLVFGTRLGLSGLGLLSTLALSHVVWSIWKAVRNSIVGICYSKCSVPETTDLYDQIVEWVTQNPRFYSVATGQIVSRHE